VRFLQHGGPLVDLLRRDRVAGHAFVYGELLLGNTGGSRAALLARYEQMHQAPTIAHAQVIAFVRERRIYGRGVGWVDAHLAASAFTSGLALWTVDKPLHALAADLGIAYRSQI
jgi:predicted nucleic acid-binding protein